MSILVACGGSDGGPTSAAEPEVKAAKVPAELEAIFDKIDSECAGNDNGFITTFDTKKFDAGQIMKDIKAEDKEKSGVDCSDQHGYSTSREDGVKLFKEHLADKNENTQECVSTLLSAAERATLDKFVNDPTNLGVFANHYSGGDNPEACSYYEYDVYSASGVHAKFVFNFTD